MGSGGGGGGRGGGGGLAKLRAAGGRYQPKGFEPVSVNNWKGRRLYVNSASGQRKFGYIDLETGENHYGGNNGPVVRATRVAILKGKRP